LTAAAPTETFELRTSYPATLAGMPFTYSATISMNGNIDPNPANNSRTINGTLP
jgi:hypothetical protein